MPFRLLRVDDKPPEPETPLEAIPPQKLGAIGVNPMVADYRFPTLWAAIMERSTQEAQEKLLATLRQDFALSPELVSQVQAMLPCLVDLKEARTKREEASIRRVQKRLASIYAGFVDRLFRYRPESRNFAVDWLHQELLNWRPFMHMYLCDVFHTVEETEPKKKGRKKA